MGKTLIGLIAQNPATTLAGAVEAPGHPAIGKDAGEFAGVGRLDVAITHDFAALATPDAVALDFTNADAALDHLRLAARHGSPIVIGSTGFSATQQAEVEQLAPRTRSVVSSNMSVGIAVLHRAVREVAAALGQDFEPEIVEIHHKMKIDAPSGTALALAKTVADATGRRLASDAVYGREGIVGQRKANEIGVMTLRGGDIVGDHTVIFAGMGERIELTHRAQSRDCLARGALRAALWLVQQPVGRYGMADVLGLR